jgi:hypothetical protein
MSSGSAGAVASRGSSGSGRADTVGCMVGGGGEDFGLVESFEAVCETAGTRQRVAVCSRAAILKAPVGVGVTSTVHSLALRLVRLLIFV